MILVALLQLAGCAGQPRTIQIGDPRERVERALGAPGHNEGRSGYEAWQYCRRNASAGVDEYRAFWFTSAGLVAQYEYSLPAVTVTCAVRVRDIPWARLEESDHYQRLLRGSDPPTSQQQFYGAVTPLYRYRDAHQQRAGVETRAPAIDALAKSGLFCIDSKQETVRPGQKASLFLRERQGAGVYLMTCTGDCDDVSFEFRTSYPTYLTYFPSQEGFPAVGVRDPTLFYRNEGVTAWRARSNRESEAVVRLFNLSRRRPSAASLECQR